MIKEYFWVAFIGVLLNAALIIANASGLLPLSLVVFGLVFLAVFLLALFRPLWVFWIFIISLPLESVIISSDQLPISFRPFQVIGVMLFVATALLIVSKKKTGLPRLPEISWADISIIGLVSWSFLSLLNALNSSVTLKLNLVLLSFGMIYFLSRFYLQDAKRKLEALWFFVATSLPILLFGVYQSLAFKFGWVDFQVFAERSNGTFTEPDWFGIYLVFLAAIIYWVKLQLFKTKNTTMIASWEMRQAGQWFLNLYLFLIFVVLILTVARSAWVGFLAVTIIYFGLTLYQKKAFKLRRFKAKNFFQETLSLGIVYLAAILLVIVTGLSNFNLANRAASSVSGLQEITISCQPGSAVPEKISGVDKLSQYGCRHIDLGEIDSELALDREVRRVYRPDPNVEIRKNIYATTWSEIKKHPGLGQGLGSSSQVLGKDSYGHGLNASNIFLEVWFSLGAVGLFIFSGLFLYPVFRSSKKIVFNRKPSALDFFIVLSTVALLIPNLFNAGIFLSLMWTWLAIINYE